MIAENDAPEGANGDARPHRASLASDLRYRALVRRIWDLGPRPFGELLSEIAPDEKVLIRRLERRDLVREVPR
jgi:hypothetical protein